MKKYVAILLLTFSGTAIGETNLCLPEAGAGVVYKNENSVKSYEGKIYDVSTGKFIQTNI